VVLPCVPTVTVFLSTSGSQVDKELFLVVSSRSDNTGPSSVNSPAMDKVSIRYGISKELFFFCGRKCID